MIDSDGNMYLIVEILLEISSIINITFRKLNVKPSGFDKGYVNNDLIEFTFYSRYIGCGFKNFETIDKEEVSYLLKSLI